MSRWSRQPPIALFGGELPKGDALAVARIAGIQAAKKTSELIPLCHPLSLTTVQVDIEQTGTGAHITARVGTNGPTGVEMEALTAASVAALSIYDMVKGLERGVGDRAGSIAGEIRREVGRMAEMRAGVLTVSDRVSRGEAEDVSGPTAIAILAGLGFDVDWRVVPDEIDQIQDSLREWQGSGVHLIVTTGGTGFAPRDVTPEATAELIDRPAPGLAGGGPGRLQRTRMQCCREAWPASPGRPSSSNLPGSTAGVEESLDVIKPSLVHAVCAH